MRRRAWSIILLLLAAGCATSAAPLTRLSRSGAFLCKCCNCFMRGDADPDAVCPACKCGHAARLCHRGPRGMQSIPGTQSPTEVWGPRG